MTGPDDTDANDHDHPSARLTRLEVEVPGDPDVVWEAIATGPGNAAWLFAADVEGREGGPMVIHREPYGEAVEATVTAWEPPHRFAYDEPIPTPDGTGTRPFATEFLVEARAGGTCVVRVVSGFRHDGEGWEDLVDGAGEGWRMALLGLRSYLTHFAGRAPAHLDATRTTGRPLAERAEGSARLMVALGLAGRKAGDPYRSPAGVPALAGTVEHVDAHFAVVHAAEPCPGLFVVSNFTLDGATLSATVLGRMYGPDAAAIAERERPRWDAWLAAHT